MTILLVAIAWTLILSLIVGLCWAARLGDVAQPEAACTDAPQWEPQPLEMLAATDARAARSAESTGAPVESSWLAA
jgi:hypothetical protein